MTAFSLVVPGTTALSAALAAFAKPVASTPPVGTQIAWWNVGLGAAVATAKAPYFVVAEALRLAPAGDVEVTARPQDGRLIVEVRTAAELTGAHTRLEDRVGAVGGTLAADPHQLRAELPCAS